MTLERAEDPAARGVARVLTVTPNPAVDLSVSCERVVPERKLRCEEPRRDPGGGGVNVARAVRILGGEASAVIAAGGATGATLERLLREEGVPCETVPLAEETRENLTVFETSTGAAYRFGLPGASMSAEEASAVLAATAAGLEAGAYVVGSGSLPPGAPPDLYASMAAGASRAGARFVLDTSGEALRRALAGGDVFLVKPNFREMGQYLGRELRGEEDARTAAAEMVERGAARLVLVTLGAGGGLLAGEEGEWRIGAPLVPVRSRIGAGDCTVAGMIAGLLRGWAPERAARYAVAAGSAAVMTEGTRLCRREDTDRLFECIGSGTCGVPAPTGKDAMEAFE